MHFVVIVPLQAHGDGRAAAVARARLGNTLDRMRREGLLVAGMIGDPDPFTATMNALQFYKVDADHHLDAARHPLGLDARRPHRARAQGLEHRRRAHRRRARAGRKGGLVVPRQVLARLDRSLITDWRRPRSVMGLEAHSLTASLPAGASERPSARRPAGGTTDGSSGINAGVALEHHDDHEHHGPPEANRSSRVDKELLGMMLFIISEIMVFGAFFTAYFFIRFVAEGHHWFPFDGNELPVPIAGVNTAILLSSSLTMHWAQTSIKNGNRFGLKAGMLLTALLGATFLMIQLNEYVHIGFSPQNHAQGTIFYGLTGLHGAHVFVGLSAARDGQRAGVPRALQSRAPPRRRGAGHLLALRRRHVGRRVHDDLHPLGAPAACVSAKAASPGSPRRRRSRSCCASSRSASSVALISTVVKAVVT